MFSKKKHAFIHSDPYDNYYVTFVYIHYKSDVPHLRVLFRALLTPIE